MGREEWKGEGREVGRERRGEEWKGGGKRRGGAGGEGEGRG